MEMVLAMGLCFAMRILVWRKRCRVAARPVLLFFHLGVLSLLSLSALILVHTCSGS
jgi:hypothetical protein